MLILKHKKSHYSVFNIFFISSLNNKWLAFYNPTNNRTRFSSCKNEIHKPALLQSRKTRNKKTPWWNNKAQFNSKFGPFSQKGNKIYDGPGISNNLCYTARFASKKVPQIKHLMVWKCIMCFLFEFLANICYFAGVVSIATKRFRIHFPCILRALKNNKNKWNAL